MCFLLTLLDSGVEVLFADMPHIPGAMASSSSASWHAIGGLRRFDAWRCGDVQKTACHEILPFSLAAGCEARP